ncbi:hypothetical protein [Xanthomonas nasturtii]|uniref:hypothetical protein n=1 Tax=Xanthomonas nasturtii TaxID=1843581 RepID=UPI002012E130|nr:hypothetical protein [Xanthomonas nasturtii]MCL1526339.1 hypothetical protein [Xanthomonas nasturtii]MCL1533470.1 hypothetical protein [Xanthomonas nasturtii]MCL1545405.1 hypothetical protein [Xanthomonas nasturtii]
MLTVLVTAQAAAVTPTPRHAPSATAAVPADDIYRTGQRWSVPGEWDFTVDSARVATVTIPNHGGSGVPMPVILLTHRYKNPGFDDSTNFKDGGASTLAFSKAHLDVVDANDAGNGGAGNYPVHIKLVEDSNGQKVGQEMVGAQWTSAFKKKPKTVKVTVSHDDSRLKLHEGPSGPGRGHPASEVACEQARAPQLTALHLPAAAIAAGAPAWRWFGESTPHCQVDGLSIRQRMQQGLIASDQH